VHPSIHPLREAFGHSPRKNPTLKKPLFHLSFLHRAKLRGKSFITGAILRTHDAAAHAGCGALRSFHRGVHTSLSGVAVFSIVL
jgi:hypothetical protein